MKEVYGDIWEVDADWRVIPTNGYVNNRGECVMGKGLAFQASQRYPGLALQLGKLIKDYGNHVFLLKPYHLFSFPVKDNWWDNAVLALVERSTEELVALVDRYRLSKIAIPRVGCGNGKLKWEEVKPILRRYLDDRFTVVFKPEK